jgi:hypothetical protein
MKQRRNDRFSYRLTVTLAGGLIALVVGGALIRASREGDGRSTDGGSGGEVRVGVASFKYTMREDALVVAVQGTAHNLEDGDAVYAVLRPGVDQKDASMINGRRWFASEAIVPTRSGSWYAVINAPSEVVTDFTVFAVQARGCPPGGQCAPGLPSQEELEREGPGTPRLGVRSPALPRVMTAEGER